MTQSKRQCPNWLSTFERWTVPRSEAPLSYIFWTGLFALSSALKRHVRISEKLLGSWDCFPNFYIFLVGPPGLRKTTTMDYLDELYEGAGSIARTPQSGTQEAIMAMLVAQKDASLAIISGDFGFLYKNSEAKLLEFFVKAFDKNRVFDNITISRGHEIIVNPSINLLTGTTPSWIAGNLDQAALSGGFAARVLWIYEEELRRYEIFYSGLDHDALNNLKNMLVHDLVHIEANISGEFSVDQDLQDCISAWYKNFMKNEAPKMDTKIQGYAQRKHRHALALAMILRVSYSDELVLTLDDFNKALTLLKSIEHRLPTVFTGVGKNPYTFSMDEIVSYVKKEGKAPRQKLLSRFRHVAEPEMLLSLLLALCTVFDRLTYHDDPNGGWYELSSLEIAKERNDAIATQK